jgi:hypothetical protein
MTKLYAKPENPKEVFQELLGEHKIGESDLERINNSLDKKAAENKLPTFAELKNLALRAVSKDEMSAGKEAFLKQMQEDIAKFAEENDTYFSKRQYADMMKRAEKTMSPLEVRSDLYKFAQTTNLTNSFHEQLRDSGIQVSSRFKDTVAQHIERNNISMNSVENLMERTVEKVKGMDFKIEKNELDIAGKETKEFKFTVNGKEEGSIVAGTRITAGLKNEKQEDFVVLAMKPVGKDGFITPKGEILTTKEAIDLAEKSLTNAINTRRVISVFQNEISDYVNTRKIESEAKKVDTNKQLEENLPSAAKTESKEMEM